MAKKNTLFIPNKTKGKVTAPSYATDMQTIERWANHQSSSFYASLTGNGELSTPGDLTQQGGFVAVSGNTSSVGIFLEDLGSNGVNIRAFTSLIHISTSVGSISIDSGAGLSLSGLNLTLAGGGGIPTVTGQPIGIVTSDTVAHLVSSSPPTVAFGLVETGHIYFWNLTSWTLLI